MNLERTRRLDTLTSQLAETMMSAAICVQEIRAAVRDELDQYAETGTARTQLEPSSGQLSIKHRPLLDESTLSVAWNERTLHLGHTLAFRFLDRISRRPNQYVTHLDLLRDVWDDEDLNTATLRSLVRELRRKLRAGGMGDLAAAIVGHNGRYVLYL
jgi:DNA-binding response OmpR family regulator